MRVLITVLVGLAFGIQSIAQSDTISRNDSTSVNLVKYSPDFKFVDGVYLNIDQLKNNRPISRLSISSTIDYNRNDFYEELLKTESFALFDEKGMTIEVKVEEIWGFCNRGVLYINWNDEFNRIPIVGSISHFVANLTTTSYIADPYGNIQYNSPYSYQSRTTSTEMRQYILDFETGKVYDYTHEAIEIILMRDPELHDEFVALRTKKKKEMKFLYLRKFNERNPLYFPANN